MSQFVSLLDTLNKRIHHFIWGPYMLAFFLLIGLLFTIKTGFFQISHFKMWIKYTLISSLTDKKTRTSSDQHSISQFQSLCTALAATLGTGNIAGVAAAIVTGGPGSIFWMWISALLGMMTTYAENVLGLCYRYRRKDGSWAGGPMAYMEKGLHKKWLAILFSIFCIFASFGMGNMTQANSIALSMEHSFGISPFITGVILLSICALVILGGLKRIASVTERLIPILSLAYIGGGLIVIFMNASQIPSAFTLILREAFTLRSAVGGMAGYGILIAMRQGISKGVFCNEAGLGSSVLAYTASDAKEPAIQGMWGIFSVFLDTIVICSITAFVILTSGVYDMGTCLFRASQNLPNLTGTALTGAAFSSIIPFGSQMVTLSILFFALATIFGWAYFGEQAVTYLFGTKAILPYQLLYIGVTLLGAITSLDFVWDISDTFNGLMAVPNLLALFLLRKKVLEVTRDFLKKKQNELK